MEKSKKLIGLKERMKNLGLSQAELARRLNCSYSGVAGFFCGYNNLKYNRVEDALDKYEAELIDKSNSAFIQRCVNLGLIPDTECARRTLQTRSDVSCSRRGCD